MGRSTKLVAVNSPEEPDEKTTKRLRREERARQAFRKKQLRAKKAADTQKLARAKKARLKQAEITKLLPHDQEISAIRADLHRDQQNRRRRFCIQLLVFIFLPALLSALYLGFVAVPLYETRAIVAITKSDGALDAGQSGLLGALATPPNLNEAFMAQEYVHSGAMMQALEEKMALVSYFSSNSLDPFQRLRDFPILQISKQAQFSRFIEAAVNIQTGLITIYCRAPSSEQAVDISNAVLKAISTQINSLSHDMFSARIEQAQTAVQDAHNAVIEAQEQLTRLQIDSGEANPQERITGIFAAIQALEMEALEMQSTIEQAEVADATKAHQTERLRVQQKFLQTRIQNYRDLLIAQENGPSLNSLLLAYDLGLLQVSIRQEILTTALESLNNAKIAAALGRSHFQVVVPPKAATVATQPNRIFLLLVVLVFATSLFSAVKVFLPRKYG